MNVVVSVLEDQIDVRLQPVDLGHLRPLSVAQPSFVFAVREADLDYEIVNTPGSSGELFAVLECYRGGYVSCAAASAKNGRLQCWHVMIPLGADAF